MRRTPCFTITFLAVTGILGVGRRNRAVLERRPFLLEHSRVTTVADSGKGSSTRCWPHDCEYEVSGIGFENIAVCDSDKLTRVRLLTNEWQGGHV